MCLSNAFMKDGSGDGDDDGAHGGDGAHVFWPQGLGLHRWAEG